MSRLKPLIIVFFSCTIFSVSLYALSQLDYQAILFVRSIHNSAIEQIGNFGNRLGDGKVLVILSFGFFLLGLALRKNAFRQTGIDSLVAHALAGVAVQIFKHIIGRPRPRFTHQEAFGYGASLQSGLDVKTPWQPYLFNRELYTSVYGAAYWYFDQFYFNLPERIPEKINTSYEVGFTVGLKSPIDMYLFDITSVGIGYRFSRNITAWRLVFGMPI